MQLLTHKKVRTYLLGFTVGLQAGCSGEDVSTGNVGNVLDGSHCFAAGCDDHADVMTLPAPPHVTCDTTLAGSFVEDFRVDDKLGSVLALRVAPDGTLWVLHDDVSSSIGNGHSIWLVHHDADGAELAQTPKIGQGSAMTTAQLSVDAHGNAWLAVYRNQAGPTADDDYTESVTLRGYDYDGEPVGPARAFSALAGAVAFVSADGEATVAGSAAHYLPRGTVLRLDANGDVLWTQPNIRTNGTNQGPGLAALVVHSDGSSTVLAERSRSYGGTNPMGLAVFGLARVGDDGSSVWEGVLDTSFVDGTSVSLVGDGADGLLLTGTLDSSPDVSAQRLLLQSFPADGGAGFAFEYGGPRASEPVVDLESGEIVTQCGRDSFLVAAPDGSSCGIERIAWSTGEGPYGFSTFAAAPGAFYYSEQWGFGRLRRE